MTTTLIIGQGITGTLVAFKLLQAGEKVMVIDAGLTYTSSRIAAGMFTPVSGKRMTLNPDGKIRMQTAVDTYNQLEKYLGVSFVNLQHIYQAFGSVKEQNDLMVKMDQPEFASHIDFYPATENGIKQPYGAFEIKHAGWLNMPLILDAFKARLIELQSYTQQAFDYSQLELKSGKYTYQDKVYDSVIFCEGYQVRNNPFFKDIEIIPCKGDVFYIACEDGPQHRIVKKGCYMVALPNGRYRVGSTYQWDVDDLIPTEEGKQQLQAKLDDMLALDYTLLEHMVGVRPTTKNREPIVRKHATMPAMYAVNGMGTKGVLHAPTQVLKLLEMLNAKN